MSFRWRIYLLVFVVQIVVVACALGLLQLTELTNLNWTEFVTALAVGAALSTYATLTVVAVVGRSLYKLISSTIRLGGESAMEKIPDPNALDVIGESYQDILQVAYNLSAHSQPSLSSNQALDNTIKTGLQNMQTGVVILDARGKIIFHNNSAPVRTDREGNTVLDLLFPEEDVVAWLEHKVKGKMSAERQWTRVGTKIPGEKDRRIYDIAASYHKDSTATTMLMLFDRTEAYTPEEDDLDFISFAAHELRGPITVIRGYLDVLKDELHPVLKNDQEELLNRLIVTSNRLTSYVNNILNASRYDRRHMKLRLTEESLQHIYDTISYDMEMRASAQHRVLVVDIPEALPTVAADVNSVGEVLSNLIDNAIKYSNEGGLVHVTARTIPGFVEVSVIDRGIGMPANIMPNLFHKFYRSHRSRETVAGTGIGLYICKAIVSSHGGSITARSVENEGSTFSFTLPIYDTVAQKLKAGNNSNVSLIEHGSGWIRNHSLYRE